MPIICNYIRIRVAEISEFKYDLSELLKQLYVYSNILA